MITSNRKSRKYEKLNKNSIDITSHDFNKEHISKDSKELSKFFKEEGNKFFNRKDYDVALIYFSKAIDYDKSNKIYYSNRSACHLAKGYFKLALRDALKSIELDPSYVKGYFRASLAYYEMNQLDKAIKLIEHYKTYETGEDVNFLIENIKKKEKEQFILKNKFPSFNRFQLFTQWLHDGDVFFAKLNIDFFSDNHRGVVSKSDIYKDEIILKIPKDMLISIELAKTTEIGEKIFSFMYVELNSPKHSLLSSFILIEKLKGENSKWKFYFDILPKDYSSFPIFYTDEELYYLEGSPFLAQVIEKKDDIKKDYERICSNIPEFNQFNFKEFCETRMIVSSRIFGVRIDFNKTDVLAPFADLLNHKRPRTTHWYYDEKYKSFVIQSLDDIPRGLEIFDSYGKKCNSRFLLNYGFVIPDNDANEFPIVLKLDESYPNFEEKRKLFKKESEYIKKFRISENILDYQVIDFFSFLRFILFDGDFNKLLTIISDNKKLVYEDCVPSFFLISPISIEHEIILLKNIEQIMLTHLNKYKTTLEEDENLLKNDLGLTQNQKNCILLRMGEKRVLNYFISFARYSLSLYNLSKEELKKKVELDYPDQECPFIFYINEVISKLTNGKKLLEKNK